MAARERKGGGSYGWFFKSQREWYIDLYGIHVFAYKPKHQSLPPTPHTPTSPLTRSKGTCLQCNFPFISSCMGFKLQLLCTPGATMHCQPQPAPLDLNLGSRDRTSRLGSGAGSHIFLCCPPPLSPCIIPKPGSTSLPHLAKRIAYNNTVGN